MISAVRNLMARAVKYFAFQHTPVSVTGVATETMLASITIPGGTLGPNGMLDVTTLFNANGSSDSKITKVKFGAAVFLNQGVTTGNCIQTKTIIRNRNNTASQVGGPAGIYAAFGNNAVSPVYAAVDTSVDQTLAVLGQVTTQTAKSVVSITRTGSIATATVTAHGYANGESVLMAGANEAEYNGTFVISNVTANTFDYTVTGTPATPATGTITSARWSTITLESVMVEVLAA